MDPVAASEPEPAGAPRRTDDPLGALTARESEVLEWVTKGLTNRDVADVLGVSARTVQKHLEHAYAKLGVETRTAAAALVWIAAGFQLR